MMTLEMPDGSVIEFPDGTTPEVMQQAAQSFMQQRAPTDQLPLPPPAGTTAGQRFMTGLGDMAQGGAQFLTNSLPQGVVDGVNNATAYVNQLPVIGPVTRALGITPATREEINAGTVQREQDFRTGRAAGERDPEGFDVPRLVGQVASTYPPALLAGAPRTMLGAAATGATTGTVLSATAPIEEQGPAYGDRLAQNLQMGAGLGSVGGVAGNLVGRALAPRISPEVRALTDAGVELTPGQVVGGGARRFEDQLASFPLGIDVARRRGIDSFNIATANEVLAPIGARATPGMAAGRDLLNDVEQQISRAYQNALSRVPTLTPDQQFASDIQGVAATRFLTPSAQAEFQTALTDRILPRVQGGPIDGQTYQTVTSELGRLARSYQGSADPAQRELAAAFRAARDAFEGLLQRNAPDAAAQLQQANQAYAGLVRMQSAGGMQGARDGVFSPAQLNAAVRQNDPSLRKGSYARGDALLQGLSDRAASVLPSTVPDSGSAGRAMAGALVGGSAAGLVDPGVLAAYLAARTAYSRPANTALTRLMTAPRSPATQAAGNVVMRSGPAAGLAFGSMLLAPPPAEPPRR